MVRRQGGGGGGGGGGGAQAAATYKVTPSGLGHYFHFDCDRLLRLICSDQATRRRLAPLYSMSRGDRLVRGALMSGGVQFEVGRVQHLRDNGVEVADMTDRALHGVLHNFRQVLAAGTVVYQVQLPLPRAAAAGGGGAARSAAWLRALWGAGCELGDATPDFLFCDASADGSYVDVVVVDAKFSSGAKFSHEVQIAMYILTLREFIEAHGVNRARAAHGLAPLRVSSTGGVWLPDGGVTWSSPSWPALPDAPVPTGDLTTVISSLESFFTTRFGRVVGAAVDFEDVSWRLTDECQNCDYVSNCRRQARGQDRAGNPGPSGALMTHVPYVAAADLRWAHGILAQRRQVPASPSNVPLRDIEDLLLDATVTGASAARLRGMLSAETMPVPVPPDEQDTMDEEEAHGAAAEAAAAHAANLAAAEENPLGPEAVLVRSAATRAVTTHWPQVKADRHSMLFPFAEDYRVVVSVHQLPAPVAAPVFAWGIDVRRASPILQLPDGLQEGPVVHVAPSPATPADGAAALRALVLRLHATLTALAFPGVDMPTDQRPRVCVFLWDSMERARLELLLLRAAGSDDAELRAAATACALTMVQGGDAVTLHVAGDALGEGGRIEEGGDGGPTAARHFESKPVAEVQRLFEAACATHRRFTRACVDAHRAQPGMEKRRGGGFTKKLMCLVLLADARRAALGLPETATFHGVQQAFRAGAEAERGESSLGRAELMRPRVATILDAVKRHMVLPSGGFYDVGDVAVTLEKGVDRQQARERVTVGRPHAVYDAWARAAGAVAGGAVGAASAGVTQRLDTFHRAITRFRAVLWGGSQSLPVDQRPTLLHAGCRFKMVEPLPLRHPLLASMAFVVQHEALQTCEEVGSTRAHHTVQRQLLEGKALHLVACGGEPETAYETLDDGTVVLNRLGVPSVKRSERVVTFTLHDDSAHVHPRAETTSFKEWIIVPATHAGRMHAVYFGDLLNCNRTFARHLARVLSVRAEGDVTYVEVEMTGMHVAKFGDEWPTEEGASYHMFRRYVNLNLTRQVLQELKRLDGEVERGERPLFMRLVRDAGEWDASDDALQWAPLSAAQRQELALNRYQLRASQSEALRHACAHHLQVVWGPPGAGKTFYISCLVAQMARLHRCAVEGGAGGGFSVLITSSTNSAIETCLEEIAARMPAAGGVRRQIIKLGRVGETLKPRLAAAGVQLVSPKSVSEDYMRAAGVCVVGSTPWRLKNCSFSSGAGAFHLVVIDEASQIPVANAAMAVRHLAPTGRLVVAGDHLQLPPVLKGCYPTAACGEVQISGSFLDCLIRPTAGAAAVVQPWATAAPTGVVPPRPFIVKLRENFRMNASLARFTHNVYGADYVSQHPERRLTVEVGDQYVPCHSTFEQADVLRQAITHPAGMSVVVLRADAVADALGGVTAEGAARAEALFVADLFRIFRAGSVAAGVDTDEIQRRVIVVTPHHVQRRAVRRQLDAIGASAVLVDTVERAQGKTADLVVVCYGVPNAQELERDFAFLLTPQRLNVSLTRAKAKVVVLAGECLLDAPVHLLADAHAQRGYALFKRAVEHSRGEGGLLHLDVHNA
jgi:hypothetical protein